MTKEQIAELERRVEFGLKLAEDEPMGSTGSEYSVRRGLMRETPLAIQRLLEERNRLLEAMREIYHEHEFDRRTEIARLAVIFAEEPAR